MGALTSTQRAAVKELLAVALSRDGYRKVTEIMQGDEERTDHQWQRGLLPRPGPDAVAGALILIANVWWRTRTRRREDL